MRLIDLTGQTFDRWVVLHRVEKKDWLCRCLCGREKVVKSDNLKTGRSRSCGCLSVEMARERFSKHDNAKLQQVTPEYRAWQGMKDRCFNPQNAAYDRYGGRGISVDPSWIHDFAAFHAHVGDRPSSGYSLDRIEVDAGYVPGNVRWATGVEQNRNRRNVGKVGGADTVSVRLAHGVSTSTYHRRMRDGWNRDDAATTAPREKRPNGGGKRFRPLATQRAP